MTKSRDDNQKRTDSIGESHSKDAAAILDAALMHVPFDGLGRDVLLAGGSGHQTEGGNAGFLELYLGELDLVAEVEGVGD